MRADSQAKLILPPGKALSIVAVLMIANGAAWAADYLPPGTAPNEAAPPPVGSGSVPQPLTAGDTGASPPPPSGQAVSIPINGTRFQVRDEMAPRHDNYFLDKDGRGKRLIMQTRPEGGGVDYEREKDLQKYDSLHYPYPPTVDGKAFQKWVLKKQPDGSWKNELVTWPTKAIDSDTNTTRFARDKPNQPWAATEKNQAPLPIVRIFCRKIVILGVVFATVFMAFAAFSVILGHKDSGQRVFGAAAGLMLLLMGYSIYKVIQINAWRFYAGDLVDWTDPSFEYARAPLPKSNTPQDPPKQEGSQKRSNLPVQPLGGPRFH